MIAGVEHQVVGLALGIAATVVPVELCHVVVGFDHSAGSRPLSLGHGEHTQRNILKGTICQLQAEERCDLQRLPLIPSNAHIHEGRVQLTDIDLPDLYGIGAAALVCDRKRALQDIDFREGLVPGSAGQPEGLHLAMHGLPVFFAYCIHSCLLRWRPAPVPNPPSVLPRLPLYNRQGLPRWSGRAD